MPTAASKPVSAVAAVRAKLAKAEVNSDPRTIRYLAKHPLAVREVVAAAKAARERSDKVTEVVAIREFDPEIRNYAVLFVYLRAQKYDASWGHLIHEVHDEMRKRVKGSDLAIVSSDFRLPPPT